MTSNSSHARRLLSGLLVLAVLASTGCGWLRGRSGYESSPESRPLEVPPDLDRPAADPSMQVPVAEAAASGGTTAAVATSFTITDATDSAWRRLGLALERIEGVSIDSRAQVLSVYNISYDGESFLVKVAADGEGSRISAVSTGGQELTTGAAGKLLALLRERLG